MPSEVELSQRAMKIATLNTQIHSVCLELAGRSLRAHSNNKYKQMQYVFGHIDKMLQATLFHNPDRSVEDAVARMVAHGAIQALAEDPNFHDPYEFLGRVASASEKSNWNLMKLE